MTEAKEHFFGILAQAASAGQKLREQYWILIPGESFFLLSKKIMMNPRVLNTDSRIRLF